MNTHSQRTAILALLVLLMTATRLHLPATLTHFGPVPDASWAVFFLGGFYLRGWTRWAFPLLMALAVAVDYWVIRGQGMNFWDHYCTSPAYWFLVPAYFALWAGGMWVRKFHSTHTQQPARVLGAIVASLFVSVVICHLLSQGSFYWISDVVHSPTLAGWWKNYSDWFIPYLRVAAIYVGLAIIAHVGVTQLTALGRQKAQH